MHRLMLVMRSPNVKNFGRYKKIWWRVIPRKGDTVVVRAGGLYPLKVLVEDVEHDVHHREIRVYLEPDKTVYGNLETWTLYGINQ